MEIDQLRTFLSILEYRSFTKAATALGISQSTVSFQIKALEDSLKSRLLDRGREGVRLTPQGEILARYARKIVTLRQEACAAMKGESDGLSGHLHIAASTVPAEYILPIRFAQLKAQFPGLSIKLDVYDSSSAIAALSAKECELAIVGTTLPDRRIEYLQFADDEIVFVGNNTSPFHRSNTAEPLTLCDLPLIGRREGSGTRAAIESLLAQHSPAPQYVLDIEVGSTQAVKECVAQGLGYAFLSSLAVQHEIRSGRLHVIPLAGTPFYRSLFVAKLRNATLSFAAAALRNLLLENKPFTASASQQTPQ